MADSSILNPFILSWEGGYVNHPSDPGGHTNKGITLSTFRYWLGGTRTLTELKNLTDAQWDYVFQKGFWDSWRADEIKSQSVANLLVDWVWASGKYGITIPQQLLGVKADGIVGPKTLEAINSQPAEVMFQRIWNRRKIYIENLRNYKIFGSGWLNRLNSIHHCYLTCNECKRLNKTNYWKTILFNDTPPHMEREEWLPKI